MLTFNLKIMNFYFIMKTFCIIILFFYVFKMGFYMEIGFQNMIVLARNSENDYTVFLKS